MRFWVNYYYGVPKTKQKPLVNRNFKIITPKLK